MRRCVGELHELQGTLLHEEDGIWDDAEHRGRGTGVELPLGGRARNLVRVVCEVSECSGG